MIRVLVVKEGGVLQEHSSRLEDKGDEQLGVDVVPGAVEPPGGSGRGEENWRQGGRPGLGRLSKEGGESHGLGLAIIRLDPLNVRLQLEPCRTARLGAGEGTENSSSLP